MKRIILVVGGVALVGFGVGALCVPMLIWDGGVTREIKVDVLDDDGEAVSGASVILVLPKDKGIEELLTEDEFVSTLKTGERYFVSDQQGRGTLRGTFRAGGTKSLARKSGNFIVEGELRVTHPDFPNFNLELRNLLQKRKFSIKESALACSVFLSGLPEPRATRKAEQGEDDRSATAVESKAQ